MQRAACLTLLRPMLRLCAAALLAALVAACAQAGPAARGMPWQGPWPAPDGAAEDPAGWEIGLRPVIFLGTARGLRIGAGAGFERRGGGVRAMVALELDF